MMGVSVNTLRYWTNEGLIEPEVVDPDSGYLVRRRPAGKLYRRASCLSPHASQRCTVAGIIRRLDQRDR